MPIPFIMHKFDMDQEDATIATWEKGEGEFVKADETVLVVETSKVAIDVPAPATGTLAGIRFKPGDVVPVTTVIAYILKEGETMADLPKNAGAPTTAAAAPVAAPAAAAPVQAAAIATPVAARMAKENGVDLSAVPAGGDRITREDVAKYLASQKAVPAAPALLSRAAVPATPAARRLAREAGVALEGIQGSGPQGRVQAADVSAAVEAQTPDTSTASGWPAEVVPLAGMRQKI